jgi:hypothetical protein
LIAWECSWITLKNKFARIFVLIIVIILTHNLSDFSYVYSKLPIKPLGWPCIICFYTIEDKTIELGLTPRRAGTPGGQLNFDFTQPLNGNLTETTAGLLYTPNKGFVGNDIFILQIKNESAPLGYSTIQVKMVVLRSEDVSSRSTANNTKDNTGSLITLASAVIAAGGLVYTARSFRHETNAKHVLALTSIDTELNTLESDPWRKESNATLRYHWEIKYLNAVEKIAWLIRRKKYPADLTDYFKRAFTGAKYLLLKSPNIQNSKEKELREKDNEDILKICEDKGWEGEDFKL